MSNKQLINALLASLFIFAARAAAADRFYISIPGPTLSYAPLYYGQERGFFAEAAKEILDTAKEALRIKDPIPIERIFDFTLAAEAAR